MVSEGRYNQLRNEKYLAYQTFDMLIDFHSSELIFLGKLELEPLTVFWPNCAVKVVEYTPSLIDFVCM